MRKGKDNLARAFESAREIEGIRRVVLSELRRTSATSFAKRVGIHPDSVRQAARGICPPSRDEARLRQFCAQHPSQEPTPEAVSLALIVASVPEAQRPAVRQAVAELIAAAVLGAGGRLTGWLEDEASPPSILSSQDPQ